MSKLGCDFWMCENLICEKDLAYDPPSQRFCQQHSDEINNIMDNWDIKKALAFWVRSHGGAEQMTKHLLGEE